MAWPAPYLPPYLPVWLTTALLQGCWHGDLIRLSASLLTSLQVRQAAERDLALIFDKDRHHKQQHKKGAGAEVSEASRRFRGHKMVMDFWVPCLSCCVCYLPMDTWQVGDEEGDEADEEGAGQRWGLRVLKVKMRPPLTADGGCTMRSTPSTTATAPAASAATPAAAGGLSVSPRSEDAKSQGPAAGQEAGDGPGSMGPSTGSSSITQPPPGASLVEELLGLPSLTTAGALTTPLEPSAAAGATRLSSVADRSKQNPKGLPECRQH